MVKTLENQLGHYDKILFFESTGLLLEFCQSQAARSTCQKLLVLSLASIPVHMENITFQYISREEVRQIKELYFMYEFSDKIFFVFRENTNYTSLYNLADTGLLSIEEVYVALLGQG